MIEHKLIRCEEDDPHRCQGVGKSGQCPYTAHSYVDAAGEVVWSKYCLRHGGNKTEYHDKVYKANLYRLQVWQQRLAEFSESADASTLKQEIGILRVTLEAILNKCEKSTDLLLYSNKISDLAIKIEKLISSSHRIEKSLGVLMDKTTALNFAERIVDIISTHVEDTEIIDAISNAIIDALSDLSDHSGSGGNGGSA